MNWLRAARLVRAHAFNWSGLSAWARHRLDGSRAVILGYHRVLPWDQVEAAAIEDAMCVSPEAFARQLDSVQELFDVLPLGEVAERLIAGRPLPRRACAICFDDGWRDNHQYAFPELARRNLPATIFVVTERVGTAGAFWPDEVARRLAGVGPAERREIANDLGAGGPGDPSELLLARLKHASQSERDERLEELRGRTPQLPEAKRELMTWSEIDELARGGIDIESHGATHAILPALGDDDVERELRSSLESLQERGYARQRLFAYPSGMYDDRVGSLVRRAGYKAAFTLEGHLATLTSPVMAIPRRGVHERMGATRAEFLCKIPGWA